MEKQDSKYIEHIEIKGLWGRYDVNWKLNSDVNILVGENGTGKSTILDIIIDASDKNGGILTLDRNPINTMVLVHNFQKYSNVIIGFSNKNQIDIKYEYENGGKMSFAPDGKGDFMEGSINERLVYKKNKNFDSNISLIRTFDNTFYEKNSYDKKNKPYLNSYLDMELEGKINEFIEYQLKRNRLLRSGLSYQDLFKQYLYLIESINRLFLPTGKKVDEEDTRLSFILKDKTKIQPYQLSSGEKQLLIILLTVLCQDEKPSILLMDEPEISLDIAWQFELLSILRTVNPNCQLIIVTHSPAIYGKGWRDKVTFIEDIIPQLKKATV